MNAPILHPANPQSAHPVQAVHPSPSTPATSEPGLASPSTIHNPPSTQTTGQTPSTLTAALMHACLAMLKLTGGSEYWTGETREALELMETALKGVRP